MARAAHIPDFLGLTRSTVGVLFMVILAGITFGACRKSYTPKPRGYPRVEFPGKQYRVYDSTCPYSFELPVYSRVVPDTDYLSEPCWVNIEFPDFDGMIHISYKIVEYIKDRNQSDILKKIIGNLNKIRYNGLFFGQCEIVDIAINFENKY